MTAETRRKIRLATIALALAIAVVAAVAVQTAQARPAYAYAKGLAHDRAEQHCWAWYPIDPFSRRCLSTYIMPGYTHYTAACRYFTFVTETSRSGAVLRTRIKSCDNSHHGYTTVVYRIDGYVGGASGRGCARACLPTEAPSPEDDDTGISDGGDPADPESGGVIIDVFQALGL